MDAASTLPLRHAITTDTLCIHCQYNLRTRTSADRCPECGTPIALSHA
jgi:predicted amidophosphoribosyltransferase